MDNPFAHDPRTGQGEQSSRGQDVPGGSESGSTGPSAADSRNMQRLVMHFALLMFATVLTSAIALPFRLVSVGFAVWGLVLGIRALRYAWVRQVRGAFIGFLTVGIVVTALLGLAVITIIPRWNIEMEYQTCRDRAITVQAKHQCTADYHDALTNYLKTLR